MYSSFFDIRYPLEIKENRVQLFKLKTFQKFIVYIFSAIYQLFGIGALIYLFSLFPSLLILLVIIESTFLVLDILFRRLPVVTLSFGPIIDNTKVEDSMRNRTQLIEINHFVKKIVGNLAIIVSPIIAYAISIITSSPF